MRTLILTIGGVLVGYIWGNIEEKGFNEIIDDLSSKGKNWFSVITKFIGQTAFDIEGFDSETIKLNIDVFIDNLSKFSSEYEELKSFDEKLVFIEEKITLIISDLIKKVEKINKKNEVKKT